MKTIRGLKIAAMVPLGFMVLVLLLLGIGEMMGGDLSGLQHFVPVVFAGLVVWLCWNRPLLGGVLLLAGAILIALAFSVMFANINASALIGTLIVMILPLAFSGLLLLTAEWVGRIQHIAPK